jgi:hypothetical protein
MWTKQNPFFLLLQLLIISSIPDNAEQSSLGDSNAKVI